MTPCPTCGKPMNEPRIVLDRQTMTAIRNGTSVNLPGQQFRMFEALHQKYPEAVTHGGLLDALYDGIHDPPLGADDSMKVVMHRLRKRIIVLNLAIETARGGWFRDRSPSSQTRYRLVDKQGLP